MKISVRRAGANLNNGTKNYSERIIYVKNKGYTLVTFDLKWATCERSPIFFRNSLTLIVSFRIFLYIKIGSENESKRWIYFIPHITQILI